jgi:hypothetical protein
MAQRYASLPAIALKVDLDSAGTNIIIDNKLDSNGNTITTDYFATDYIPATLINDSRKLWEFVLIDASTFSNIDTTGATLFKRGLNFYATGVTATDQTEVTANKLDWTAGETKLLLGTNPPYMYGTFTNKNNAETIEQVWVFKELPELDVYEAPTSDEQFAAKKYVDDIAAGGTASINRLVPAAIAGETVAAGDPVYLDTTDGEWKLTDANTTSTIYGVILGIAQGAGTDGNTISGGVLLSGFDSNQSGFTQGDDIYISDTTGELTDTPGTNSRKVGIAYSATEIYFDPNYSLLLTPTQQSALAGNGGTPSSTNTYVTQIGLQEAQEVYAATSTGSDAYAITLSPAPTAYNAGMTFRVKLDVANTGAATLNVNSLGAVTIKKNVSDDLETGDLQANQVITVVYDGTNFILVSQFPVYFSRKLDIDTTDTTVGNTASETNLVSYSVGAGILGTGNAVRLKGYITTMAQSTNELTLRMKYGSTTIASLTIDSANFAADINRGEFEALLVADGATNSQEGVFQVKLLAANTSTITSTAVVGDLETGTASEDSTGALNLVITAQWGGAAAGDTLTLGLTTIELIQS